MKLEMQSSVLAPSAARAGRPARATRLAVRATAQPSGSVGVGSTPGQGRVLEATIVSPTTDATRAYSSTKTADSLKATLEATRGLLESELRTLFPNGALTKELFSRSFSVDSPLGGVSSFQSVQRAITVLRTLARVTYSLRSLKTTGTSEITARWAVTVRPRLPTLGQPSVSLTGRSVYSVDLSTGEVEHEVQEWDALPSSANRQLAALALVVRQGISPQTTPRLESPSYTLLKKAPGYEIRQYASYLVAETTMPASEGLAGGTGFQDLAGYIFGGNRRSARMEMTTPVFTSRNKMQFPLEKKMGVTPEQLPTPDSPKVTTKKEEGGTYGVINFPGIPLDFQVVEAERRLRALLLVDGLQPADGCQLARYNDPFTLPFARRNEVLIALEDYETEE